MLSVSVVKVRRSSLRISRARRRRTGSPPQGPPGTRSVGGLRTLRSFVEPASMIPASLRQWSQAAGALETTASAPFFDRDVSGMRGRKVQGTNTVSKLRRASLAFSLSAVRAVLRLTHLRCWVVPGRDSSSSASSGRRVPSLHSAVRLRRVITCLLFLQALCLFRLVRGPSCAAVRARLQSHKAFRAGRTQPSASAPGCWRRQCRDSATLHPPQTAPGAWCQA